MIDPLTTLSNIDGISPAEKKLLDKVMSNYNFEVVEYKKTRSAYKVQTSTCNLCLKRMKHGINKASNGYILVEELHKNNFIYTPRYIKTRDGNLFVKANKLIFYVTEWIDGGECDLSTLDEALQCSILLANFHKVTRKLDIKGLKIRNNLKNWPKVFSGNLNDLEKFKKIIERKKIRNEFDLMYISCIENFYNRGISALGLLNKSDYYKLSKTVSEKKTICHDSFYYQNILKKDNNYYIIDLDSIIIDLQINDLGKFIRRLMFKNEYQWSFEKAKSIIEAYESIIKLSKNELEIMLALIIFPHKFWKLGKKRYVKAKNWNEEKYAKRFNKLVKYNELQQKFFEDYIAYIETLN